MAITISIPGTAIGIIDVANNITITLQVRVLDGVTVIGDAVLTVVVFFHTADLLNYSVSRMVDAIAQFKTQCIKQRGITANFTTFTDLVKAAV